MPWVTAIRLRSPIENLSSSALVPIGQASPTLHARCAESVCYPNMQGLLNPKELPEQKASLDRGCGCGLAQIRPTRATRYPLPATAELGPVTQPPHPLAPRVAKKSGELGQVDFSGSAQGAQGAQGEKFADSSACSRLHARRTARRFGCSSIEH